MTVTRKRKRTRKQKLTAQTMRVQCLSCYNYAKLAYMDKNGHCRKCQQKPKPTYPKVTFS